MRRPSNVVIKTHYSADTPIEAVPENERRRLARRKVSFIGSMFRIELPAAIRMLDEIENGRLWELDGSSRYDFFYYLGHIDPVEFDDIRQGAEIIMRRESKW